MTANSFGSRAALQVAGERYEVYRLDAAEGSASLPFSLKILLENLLRNEDGVNITASQISALANWDPARKPDTEIQFTPARVILQDLTGVPAVVDLAAMREAMQALGGDPTKINPLIPAELVIDHSVVADVYGSPDAFSRNVEIEFQRNHERFQFLRWGQDALRQFKVVPPGTGIVHQVNIEYLARVVMTHDGSAYPDTCVGTDSHTTMQNGLGVLGWGVGGIEAEAAMLGQAISMLIPEVVGFGLTGELPSGTTATDLVLTITELLRKHGVVGKFVEFHGEGVAAVPVANRATIGNMSPEFGSTCAIFPIDQLTLDYLKLTGRPREQVGLVEAYAKEQGLWHDPERETRYSEELSLDLSTVVPSIAGPKRPQDRITLADAKQAFRDALPDYVSETSLDNGLRRHLPGLGSRGDQRWHPRLEPDPGHARGWHDNRRRPRLRGHRRHHLLHQHVQPERHGRRRAARQERGRPGTGPQAVGQDHAGARLQGGHGLLRARRAAALPRQARLQPGRLRLHHVHRQLRAAAARDQRGGERERPGGDRRAVGEQELRGPHQPGREDELPGLSAAGGGVRADRDHGHRHAARAARLRRRGQAGLPCGHLAVAGGSRRRGAARGGRGDVHPRLRRRVHGRRQLARARHPVG